MVPESIHPTFAQAIVVDYHFEQKQDMRVEVRQFGGMFGPEGALLSFAEFPLDAIPNAPGGSLQLPLKQYRLGRRGL